MCIDINGMVWPVTEELEHAPLNTPALSSADQGPQKPEKKGIPAADWRHDT